MTKIAFRTNTDQLEVGDCSNSKCIADQHYKRRNDPAESISQGKARWAMRKLNRVS